MVKAKPEPLPTPSARPATPAAPIPSAELLRGRREAVIAHRDELYRLRETRNGKLILTK
ncbi:MAG: hemin uptake protein HemP [Rhodocyclales bacterium]|nr:hemin uptake protein HemP [Rhodocyclales bacterium]